MITFALTMKRSIILATFGLYSVSLAAPVLEVRDTANDIVNRSCVLSSFKRFFLRCSCRSHGTTVIGLTAPVPTRATSTNVEFYDLVARSDSALASLTTSVAKLCSVTCSADIFVAYRYAPTPSSVAIPRHGSSYHPYVYLSPMVIHIMSSFFDRSHNSITLTSERPISTTKPSRTNPGSNLSQDGYVLSI